MVRTKKATKLDQAIKEAKDGIVTPTIIRGSHSTRTEYPDGRIEFVTHWDELVRDVNEALATISTNIIEVTESKVKKTRAKKTKA